MRKQTKGYSLLERALGASSYSSSRTRQRAKAMPKVKVVQADTLQSGRIDNAGEISQGLFKKTKKLKVAR